MASIVWRILGQFPLGLVSSTSNTTGLLKTYFTSQFLAVFSSRLFRTMFLCIFSYVTLFQMSYSLHFQFLPFYVINMTNEQLLITSIIHYKTSESISVFAFDDEIESWNNSVPLTLSSRLLRIFHVHSLESQWKCDLLVPLKVYNV
jgi:hypothetical protein